MFAMLVLLPASLLAAPALRDVEQLPPAAAGELLLRDQPHRPIVSTLRKKPQPMDPPGVIEFELVEAPLTVADGCARRRWTATFFKRPDGGADDATFRSAYAVDEVSLPSAAGCAGSNYAHVNPGLNKQRAIRMLRTLQQIATGALPVSFTCKSVQHDPLCANQASIEAALARTPPWVVTSSGGFSELWLKGPGGTVTTVRFDGDRPHQVFLVREYPAPF